MCSTTSFTAPVLDLAEVANVTKVKLTWAMKMVSGGSFSYLWTLKKTMSDGSKKFSNVVSGEVAEGETWSTQEAEFLLGDLAGVHVLSIYLGGTPTDASFYLDEVRDNSLQYTKHCSGEPGGGTAEA